MTERTFKAGFRAAFCLSTLVVLLAVPSLNAQAQNAPTSDAPADKRWLAVAPGRVEPVSGLIRIAAPVVGVVDEVLAKANDKVFAGQPLVRLRDQEARAQLASVTAQVAMRKRIRNKEFGIVGRCRTTQGRGCGGRCGGGCIPGSFPARQGSRRTAGRPRFGCRCCGGAFGLKRAEEYLVEQTDELRRIAPDAPLPTVAEGQLKITRSELSASRAGLEKLTIRAPIDGTILQIKARPGEVVSPSTPPLVELGDTSALRVRAEVDERDIEKIKPRQSVLVRPAALRGREVAGIVSLIAPIVEAGRYSAPGQRNMTDVDVVEVLIELSEPVPLVVGMKVDVYFQHDTASR